MNVFIYTQVPNQRAKDQVQLNLVMKQDFLDEIDAFCKAHNIGRSQFVRDAIAEKIIRDGELTGEELKRLERLASAPSRIGVGGAKKTSQAKPQTKEI